MKKIPAPLFFADTSKKLLVNTQSAQKSFFQTLNNYALFETLLLQCAVCTKYRAIRTLPLHTEEKVLPLPY